jgi:putative methyltransferase (TIGR04325 family)
VLKFGVFTSSIRKKFFKYAKLKSCKKIFSTNYNDEHLTTSIVKKTLEYSRFISEENSIPITALRTALPFALGEFQRRITVLDFGGGAGTTYFEAKYFSPNKDFKWIILETKTMANMAESMNTKTNELKYISNFKEIDDIKIDLIIANSSLQYTDNPIDYLNKLINIKAKYLFITRTPLTNEESIKVLQTSILGENGPQIGNKLVNKTRINIPATVISKNVFENLLESCYQIKYHIIEEKSSFNASGRSFDLFGYFCELNIEQ